jgi:hypothetical protein
MLHTILKIFSPKESGAFHSKQCKIMQKIDHYLHWILRKTFNGLKFGLI